MNSIEHIINDLCVNCIDKAVFPSKLFFYSHDSLVWHAFSQRACNILSVIYSCFIIDEYHSAERKSFSTMKEGANLQLDFLQKNLFVLREGEIETHAHMVSIHTQYIQEEAVGFLLEGETESTALSTELNLIITAAQVLNLKKLVVPQKFFSKSDSLQGIYELDLESMTATWKLAGKQSAELKPLMFWLCPNLGYERQENLDDEAIAIDMISREVDSSLFGEESLAENLAAERSLMNGSRADELERLSIISNYRATVYDIIQRQLEQRVIPTVTLDY